MSEQRVSRLSMPDAAKDVTACERGTMTPRGSLRAWPVVVDQHISGGSTTLPFMRRRVPRAVNVIAQAVVFPALLVGVPLELSRFGRRHGWSDGRPGPVNLVGAIPLGAGAALLVWAMSSHYRAAPQGWEIRLAPDYLLRRRPLPFLAESHLCGRGRDLGRLGGVARKSAGGRRSGGADGDPGRRRAHGGARAP